MAQIAKQFGYTLTELRKLQEHAVTIELRVELFHDDEAGNWHYRVPALHINGGGTPTHGEAEQDCLAAIDFALAGDPADYDDATDAVTFKVQVTPAA